MNLYHKCLLILKELFRQSGDSHWQNWIEQDIEEWDVSKSTHHHKSAFGGMGSINDQPVGGQSKKGYWQNNLFDLIKNISWTLATHHSIDLETNFITKKAPSLEGRLCRDCSYAQISHLDIENYLSSFYLPKLILEILPTQNFLDLTKIHSLIELPDVVEQREIIIDALEANDIKIVENNNSLRPWPKCSSSDNCVYRWGVVIDENQVVVRRSDDNLKVKNASKNTTTSWWRRLMGYR